MTVTYLSSQEAANAAVTDLKATTSSRAGRPRAPGFDLVSATALVSAISAAGQLGLGVGQAATEKDDAKAQTLEIEFDNESQLPVVIYDVKTSASNTARFPRPLGPDEADTLVLARNSGFDDGESGVEVQLMVGGVVVQLDFNLDQNAVWQASASIKGKDSDDNWPDSEDGDLDFYGAQVTDSDSAESFSIYTASIEKTAGLLSVTVLDLASS